MTRRCAAAAAAVRSRFAASVLTRRWMRFFVSRSARTSSSCSTAPKAPISVEQLDDRVEVFVIERRCAACGVVSLGGTPALRSIHSKRSASGRRRAARTRDGIRVPRPPSEPQAKKRGANFDQAIALARRLGRHRAFIGPGRAIANVGRRCRRVAGARFDRVRFAVVQQRPKQARDRRCGG